jgi:heterogeneous nuclear ribonucleoprotein F/H
VHEQGVEPIDVVLVKRDGRLTGEAFVVLSGPMHVEHALSKNRSYMGRRYIEIFRAKKQVRWLPALKLHLR